MKILSLSRNRPKKNNSDPGIVLDFMRPQGPQQHVTENYFSVPPALTITDYVGAIWTLGWNPGDGPRGEFSFNVLRNGESTGEFASRIEMRGNRVRCFTSQGWKVWNGRSFF